MYCPKCGTENAETKSAPTTNELAPSFSATEPTMRRLEPLIAENRSGDLV